MLMFRVGCYPWFESFIGSGYIWNQNVCYRNYYYCSLLRPNLGLDIDVIAVFNCLVWIIANNIYNLLDVIMCRVLCKVSEFLK